jgi:hypothetical protein
VPINQKGVFDQANITDYSDISTANMLATMTKGLQLINEMTESLKHNQMGNENAGKNQGRSIGSMGMVPSFSRNKSRKK